MKIFKNLIKNPIAIAIIISSIILALSVVAYSLINKKSVKEDALNQIMNQDKYFNGLAFQKDEYILGNPDNKIVWIIYSDPECPFCKMLHQNTVEQIRKDYGLDPNDYTKSKIAIVYRHYGLSFHTKAPLEINALLCSRELYGQNVYLNSIDRIYDVTPANNGLDDSILPDIVEYAYNLTKSKNQSVLKDFNKEEFQNCYNSYTYNTEFEADQNDATEAGLDGTPYSVIVYKDKDNRLIVQKVSGAMGTDYFENIFNKLLKIK